MDENVKKLTFGFILTWYVIPYGLTAIFIGSLIAFRLSGHEITALVVFLTLVAIILIGVAAFIAGAFFYIKRKSHKLMQLPPVLTETIKVDTGVTLEGIKSLLLEHGYTIATYDSSAQRLVAEDKWSISSWGYFYPIFLADKEISIGIISKFAQSQIWNPVTKAKHAKIINVISSGL